MSQTEKPEPRNRHERRAAKSKRGPASIPPILNGQIVCKVKQAAEAIGVANSTMWDYVARGLVDAGGPAVVEVGERRQALGHDVVAGLTAELGDERDAAGVVLERRVVQSLSRAAWHHHGFSVSQTTDE